MHFCALILAALVAVAPGENPSGAAAGEIAAVRLAATSSTNLTLSTVETFATYTNTYADVVSYETAYAITYTNFDGEASISTNVIGYVDYAYFQTNGVSKILTGPTRFDLPITNAVQTGEALAAFVTATNDIITATVNGFEVYTPTNLWWFGGGSFLLTPADAPASASIIIR